MPDLYTTLSQTATSFISTMALSPTSSPPDMLEHRTPDCRQAWGHNYFKTHIRPQFDGWHDNESFLKHIETMAPRLWEVRTQVTDVVVDERERRVVVRTSFWVTPRVPGEPKGRGGGEGGGGKGDGEKRGEGEGEGEGGEGAEGEGGEGAEGKEGKSQDPNGRGSNGEALDGGNSNGNGHAGETVENDIVWTLTMDDSGLKVREAIEFIDSAAAARIGEIMSGTAAGSKKRKTDS